jgi:hypothetical protein
MAKIFLQQNQPVTTSLSLFRNVPLARSQRRPTFAVPKRQTDYGLSVGNALTNFLEHWNSQVHAGVYHLGAADRAESNQKKLRDWNFERLKLVLPLVALTERVEKKFFESSWKVEKLLHTFAPRFNRKRINLKSRKKFSKKFFAESLTS